MVSVLDSTVCIVLIKLSHLGRQYLSEWIDWIDNFSKSPIVFNHISQYAHNKKLMENVDVHFSTYVQA